MQRPLLNQYPGLIMKGACVGQYTSEDRNLFHNGDMYIDQVNEGASVTLSTGTASYIVDGAKVLFSQASAAVTAQQVSDAPDGFIKSLKVTVGTGATVGSGDYLVVKMPIEGTVMRFLGQGLANSGYMSLTFWLKTSKASQVISACLQNSAGNRTYIAAVTTSSTANTWQQFTVQNIPGDITGTWLNGANAIGMQLIICAASGSTNQSSTVNAWQAASAFAQNANGLTQSTAILSTSGATFQVTGVQLEPGTSSTPYALLPYDRQLQKCRRFYQKSFPVGTAPAQNAGVTGAVCVKNPIAAGEPSCYVPFTPGMSAAPTIVTYNPSGTNANWRDVTASSDATVSVDPATAVGQNGVLLASSGTVATLGDILAIHYTADTRL